MKQEKISIDQISQIKRSKKSGYTLSKWVSDIMVQEAFKCGIKGNIFRPYTF